jgi:sulfide:quinone oxidoreductase
VSAKTIVVLGGGVGGMVTANEVSRLAPGNRVVLVERNEQHAFAPSFLWIMTGDRRPEQIQRPLRSLVRPGVDIVHAEVTGIDLDARHVTTDAETLTYDYLVVALGAELAMDAVPGLGEGAHTFYSLDGAIALRDALADFDGRSVAVVVTGLPYKCPGAPLEGAMLIRDMLGRRRSRESVDIGLYTPEPAPMALAGVELSKMVVSMLAQRDISYHPGCGLTSVDPDARELQFDGKPSVQYDLLVTIPPHRPPSLLRDAGLAGDSGWAPVDRQTLETDQENVYALGDAAAVAIPGRWNPEVGLSLPKAGVFAHGQAEVIARRIAADIAGSRPTATYGGVGYCMLEAGGGVAGFAHGDFYAEPSPDVRLRPMGRHWHLGKELFERWWLTPFGIKKSLLGLAMRAGARTLGVPDIV